MKRGLKKIVNSAYSSLELKSLNEHLHFHLILYSDFRTHSSYCIQHQRWAALSLVR